MAKRGNGEGSIYKRNDGRWMGSLSVKDKNNNSTRKTVYGKTKSEVISKMDLLKHDIRTGSYVEPDKITVAEWLKTWLEVYKKKTIKPRTYDSYETIINVSINPNIGNVLLQKLKSIDVQKMYNKRLDEGLSANSIHKIQIVLKSALEKAISEGYIVKNPASRKSIELPSLQKKEIVAFTQDEQKRFEEAAKNYSHYVSFIFDLDTGLRMSELLALTWDDINFENEEVSINKNLVKVRDRKKEKGFKNEIQKSSGKTKNSIRVVPLTQRVIALLKELKIKQQIKSNIVFISELNTYITSRNYSRAFQRVITKAGVRMCNVHTMRHTFATRLFEKGAAAKTISELLGHASVSFTLDTYTHVMPNTKKQAIELLESVK